MFNLHCDRTTCRVGRLCNKGRVNMYTGLTATISMQYLNTAQFCWVCGAHIIGYRVAYVDYRQNHCCSLRCLTAAIKAYDEAFAIFNRKHD